MKLSNARQVAYELLRSVAVAESYANLELPRLLASAKLDQRDAAFAQELSFGTLRNRIFYDAILEVAAQRPIEQVDIEVRCVLELGAHQLLAMRVPSHAALSETVNLAKQVLRPSLSGFVNGVLRRVSERDRESWLEHLLQGVSDRVSRLEIQYSHPAWIIRALQDALRADNRADELELLLSADNAPPLVHLAALPGRTTREASVQTGLHADGISPIGLVLEEGDPAKLPGVKRGELRVQDQGSQIVTLALLAAPLGSPSEGGEEWLDMCAGPGGKAALLAAAARQSGAELVCNELQPHRAKLVEQALRHTGSDCYVRVGDARNLGDEAPASFDRILLDAPCSGLGALRRRTESRFRKNSSDIAELTKLQRELFASAVAGLRSGGVLAYVTCSPHLAETTAIVEWALKSFESSISLLDARKVIGGVSPVLVSEGGVQLGINRKTVQFWPHVQSTDAMFLALFRKV